MFISTLSLTDSSIYNIILSEASIQIVSSSVTMRNVSMANVQNPLGFDFIVSLLDSEVTIENSSFKESNSNFLKLRTSKLKISNFTLEKVESAVPILRISESTNVELGKKL